MEVKQLVTEWRSLSGQLKTLNDALESSRSDLNKLEADHAEASMQWEQQKDALTAAIEDGRQKLAEATKANAAALKEADELMKKAMQRRERNAEHTDVLNAKKRELAALQSAADAEDTERGERLASFRASRDALRSQLQQAVSKLSAMRPKEQNEAQEKLEELAKKQNALAERAVAEERAWTAEVARRRAAKRREFRVEIEKEISALTNASVDWTALLQQVPLITSMQSASDEIADIRSRIRVSS